MNKIMILVLGLILGQYLFAQVSYDSLRLHYPFSNNTVDLSGNNNRGIVYGAGLTKDRFNRDLNAYQFDGIDDFIEFNAEYLLQPFYSYSVWAFPYTIPSYGSIGTVISVGNSTNGADHCIALCNNYSIGKMTGWTIWGYTNNGLANTIEQKAMPEDSTWYHVVMVRDTNDLKLYIDGDLVSTRAIEGDAIYGEINSALLGKRNVINQNFHGKIDDVRIYNRPLSSEEIFNLSNENIYYEFIDTVYRTFKDTSIVLVIDTNYVTVHDTNYVAVYDSISVTDTLVIDINYTEINSSNPTSIIKIYPNPTKDILYVDYGKNYNEFSDYVIKIISLTGQIVYESKIDQKTIDINMEDFGGTGLYYLQIINGLSEIKVLRKILLE